MNGKRDEGSRRPPEGLAEMQRSFTHLLRIPLELRGGRAIVDPRRYDPHLVHAASDGPRATARVSLSVYHRQYWFRLFEVMQQEFLLTARLVGLPDFYILAQAYLIDSPPRSYDLGRMADGFVAWCISNPSSVEEVASTLPLAALYQGLAIDGAFRDVWRLATLPAFVPSAHETAELPRTQLRLAPTAALVEEDWPLVELRRALMADARANSIALPSKLDRQHWLVTRTAEGIGQLRLAAQQARLYALCARYPLGEAVSLLYAESGQGDDGELTDRVRVWLARSMELKLWVTRS